MNKKGFKGKLKDFLPACIVAVALLLLAVLGIYRCPLDFIFGVPCPMCGMTRAFMALLDLKIAASFYFHPLWPLVTAGVLMYILNYFEVIKVSKFWGRMIFGIICAAVAGCFVIRHILHSPIVAIHFEDSLVYRAYSLLVK